MNTNKEINITNSKLSKNKKELNFVNNKHNTNQIEYDYKTMDEKTTILSKNKTS